MSKAKLNPEVNIDVFHDSEAGWQVEVGLVDAALHKQYGNPLLYSWGHEDAEDAKMCGFEFSVEEGHPVNKVTVH